MYVHGLENIRGGKLYIVALETRLTKLLLIAWATSQSGNRDVCDQDGNNCH